MEAAVYGGAFAQPQAHEWAPAQEAWAQLLSTGILPSRINSGTPAGRDKPSTCQVPGCCADLSAEKLYCMRKRICSKHMQAPYLEYPGNTLYRYCFQCAKVEPLACFDGTKRSCRQALHKRKLRTMANPMQQTQQASTASAAATAAAAVAVPAFAMVETRQGNPLDLQLQQQAQLLQQQQAAAAAAPELQQLQQLQRQQQQQQQMVPLVSAAEVQQLAALTSSLTATAEQMQSMLSATRTQMRSRSNSPAAHILDQQQQQQYVAPMTGYPSPEAIVADSSSRTPSPRSAGNTFAPGSAAVGPAGGDLLGHIERTLAAVGNNTAAAAATTAAATAGATSAAAAVADSDFDSFLETLLDDLPESGPDSSLTPSGPSCSSSGCASLSTQYFPPILGGGCARLEPTLPATAVTSTPGYVNFSDVYTGAGAGSTGPAVLEATGSGLSSDSCSTGMGAGALLAESRARTQQQLQYLSAALQQVQKSLMALTQTAQARY